MLSCLMNKLKLNNNYHSFMSKHFPYFLTIWIYLCFHFHPSYAMVNGQVNSTVLGDHPGSPQGNQSRDKSHQETSPHGGSTAGGGDCFASCTHWSFFPKKCLVWLIKRIPKHSNNSDPVQALLLSGTIWPLKTRGLSPSTSKTGRVGPNIRQTVLGMTKIIIKK